MSHFGCKEGETQRGGLALVFGNCPAVEAEAASVLLQHWQMGLILRAGAVGMSEHVSGGGREGMRRAGSRSERAEKMFGEVEAVGTNTSLYCRRWSSGGSRAGS